MYKRLFPSVEHIRQQSGAFFDALVKTIDEIKAEGMRPSKWGKEEGEKLAKVINKYVNSNVRVVLGHYDAFYMKEYWETLLDKKKRDDFIVDGALDYNTGKLKGDFASLEVELYSSNDIFEAPFTTEEAAAIMLHESGHMATLLDLATRLILSNFALRDLAEKYNASMSLEERRGIIVTSTKNLKLKKEQIDAAAQSDKLEVIAMMIAKGYEDNSRSELGCDLYDYTSAEFLADQYATKQGAGRHLITGLEKFGVRSRSRLLENIQEVISISFWAAMSTGWVMVGNPLGVLLSAGILVAFLYGSSPSEMELRYNRPEERLIRIRLQMIARLNDKGLSNSVREKTRHDIKLIDQSIKFVKDNHSILEKLAWFILPSLRKRASAQELQMQLEKLALNDLYLKAYDLKQIA